MIRKKREPIVLWAIVCADGTVHDLGHDIAAYIVDGEQRAKDAVRTMDEGFKHDPYTCSPHRVVRLVEEKRRRG